MRIALILAACAMAPATALAGMTCTFHTECLEGEDCIDSGFALNVETALTPSSIAQEGGLPVGDTIVTDTQTITITWMASGAGLAAFGPASSGFQMLSVRPDGEARYSVHLPRSDLSILYIGSCEGT